MERYEERLDLGRERIRSKSYKMWKDPYKKVQNQLDRVTLFGRGILRYTYLEV